MMRRTFLSLMSLGGLVLAGCVTTYELSPAPPGHPASPGAPEATAERSKTLARAEPVDPQPARSEHWARQGEDHEHPGHEHMHHPGPEPDAPRADRPHRHPDPHPAEAPAPDDFDGQLAQVLDSYFGSVGALADDDLEAAASEMERLQANLEQIDPGLLDTAQRQRWLEIHQALGRSAQRFLDAPGIEAARTAFEPISQQMEKAVRELGSAALGPVHVVRCPMAFGGRGADWLQPHEEVNNPYYGAAMLRCGSVEETLLDEGGTDAPEQGRGHDHDGHR